MCFINKLTQFMCFINMQASQRHEPSDTHIWWKFKVADFSNTGIALFEIMQSRLVYFSFVNFWPST